MRSQATKPLPKKGALGKTVLKASSVVKPTRKKGVSPKKVKNLASKSLVKSPKKTSSKESKDELAGDKNDGESTSTDKSDASTESIKSGQPKGNASRSNSPTKKTKKDSKEKKDPIKVSTEDKNTVSKKIVKNLKKTKSGNKSENEDDVKYKINLDVAKKATSKFSKAKTIVKRSNINQKKKVIAPKKQEKTLQENEQSESKNNKNSEISEENKKETEPKKDSEFLQDGKKEEPKSNESTSNPTNVDTTATINAVANISAQPPPGPPKVEIERPPKFFTSSRSPRMVDIDLKFCKNSKGVSERFMKCETKTDESNKEKTTVNTLISQGPDVDVYTFTEKVDSPKSILSDFRSPMNKNIGRVRPIARVKGTVIDKKDPEKKKFSPHRPIEEVVKQLKANKRSEELASSQNQHNEALSSADSSELSGELEEKPKPIVSKSYKMVARKSSITGKPFSPIKFLDQEPIASKTETTTSRKSVAKTKKQKKKASLSDDDEFESSKFAFNTKAFHYSSSEESVSESNDDNDTKESSSSDTPKKKKNKKYKRITDCAKKNTSKELRELSKDSLIDVKGETFDDKPSKRRLKLYSMWAGPKKHRMASLNAIAKVHCLYENESRTHMELGLMRTVDRQVAPSTSKATVAKKKETKLKETAKQESTSESEYEGKKDKKEDSSESSDDNPPQRSLRGDPGIRSAGKYWDPKSSTSSSEDSELESKKKVSTPEKKKATSKTLSTKLDTDKPPAKMKKTAGVPVKKKRNRNEVVMDLKDMVVQKRMASLNATAILAASYEKRSPKSSKDDTTSDSCSDESFSQKSKNGVLSGVKSEIKHEDTKKEVEEPMMTDSKQKVEVIVNQDTDVTITGVYSTHLHEGFCTVSGMQYRISSTSHTQTTATANCEKEGCSRDESRYTPLSALSSMQPPPADHAHGHPHPVPELGGLARRAAGCSSAFSAPSPSAHHEPGKPLECSLCDAAFRSASLGYYQPAGPMIKESGADADRALARYHPPHYHAPHPPVLQQYGGPYYPADLCYGRYYRPPGPPYHMPPQPDAQMVGVGSEPYPPPQYYGTPPCYQHSPQRIPYVEYRGCPCPLNACPKNVLIGPATGKAPTGAGPDVPSALAPPGGAFRPKVRACALDAIADTHGSGKDPPHEQEPPAAADAPHPCPLPAIGGASPKRELYDVRDKIRLVGDIPGPAEALGPPSPARGSAGACAPQPPPIAPRRARLGKEAARKSLADTGQLILTPQQPPPAHSNDADDDVMAISPPSCAPIDLSSSDERSTPLVDVKKENDGPTCAASRNPDAQALREHNSTSSVQETTTESTETTKAVKRRYSRPKLEIDMNNIQLEESCKTNGIGEHVKLQKRRKVSGDQTTIPQTVTKDTKKKVSQSKRIPKTPSSEKRTVKRKIGTSAIPPKAKKMLLDPTKDGDTRLKEVDAVSEVLDIKSKTKSAMLLDNLIRKNSIDRADTLSEKKLNPVELFLSPNETGPQNGTKKTLNINNNVVENSAPLSGVRPNTIAAVTQLIEKKLACKKLEKVDSKITHSLKSVLKTPTDKLKNEISVLSSSKCKLKSEKNSISADSDIKAIEISKDALKDNLKESLSVSNKCSVATEDGSKSAKVSKVPKPKASHNKNQLKSKLAEESHSTLNKASEENEDKTTDLSNDTPQDKSLDLSKPDKNKRNKAIGIKVNGQMKNKSIENVAKLLSKKPVTVDSTNDLNNEESNCSKGIVESLVNMIVEKTKTPAKVNGEIKTKSIENVAKLLKKPVEADATIITEEDQSKRPSAETVVEPERTVTEKILPKRCKLTNGELKEEKKKKVEKVVKLLVSKKPAIKTDEATLVVEDACASPVPSVGRRAKRRRSGAGMRRVRRLLAPPPLPATEPRAPPRWSNGWHWDGEHYVSKVYLNNDSRFDRTARCWQRMSHASGDNVARGDCVLLKASTGKSQQPFVARVASLWENPEDGEMMVSLVWYYRPEHTERGREPADAPDEVFASRHRDANSVACIEDKCYVLTFNEYCRYRKRLKAAEEGITITPSIVPPLPASEVTPAVQPNDTKLPPGVSSELVLFCRKIYDFRSKKIQVPNK